MTLRDDSGFDKRRFRRMRVPVLYSPPRMFGPPRVFGQRRQISDISLGGLRIYSDEPLKEGKGLDVELFLPMGQSVKAIARVVWIEELPGGSDARYDVGLEFIHLPPVATNEIKSMLNNQSTN